MGTPLGPKYIPNTYMDPLGFLSSPKLSCCHHLVDVRLWCEGAFRPGNGDNDLRGQVYAAWIDGRGPDASRSRRIWSLQTTSLIPTLFELQSQLLKGVYTGGYREEYYRGC